MTNEEIEMLNGQHDFANVQSLKATEDKSVWSVRLRNGLSGTLTLEHEGGTFDAWDWEGPELNEDEMQSVLDIFDPLF